MKYSPAAGAPAPRATRDLGAAVQGLPLGLAHHMEMRLGDRPVVAVGDRLGHGHGGRPQASMIRYSRHMSCAFGSSSPSGGRRTTSSRPPASVRRYVRLEWPPGSRSHVIGDSTGDRGQPGSRPSRRRSRRRHHRVRTACVAIVVAAPKAAESDASDERTVRQLVRSLIDDATDVASVVRGRQRQAVDAAEADAGEPGFRARTRMSTTVRAARRSSVRARGCSRCSCAARRFAPAPDRT